ncbi:MAG: chitobiase/beta-hexosaminidase C-terminal domain-containing protein [Spirochaetia bacterium]|jgi:nucleoid-associated protein YgaU
MTRFIGLAAIVGLSIVLVACPSTPKPPTGTVAAPAFSPAEGIFTSSQTVALASSTEGAEIRYTTDSTAPSATTGTLYAGPITVSATTTIRAIASKTGWEDSPVVSATYTITGKVADVQFSPGAGAYDTSATVSLSTTTEGAQIYFTTDGSEPTTASGILYAGPISVTATETIKAIGVKKSWDNSAVATADYTINVPAVVVETPTVPPITDVEIDDARNALARAKEVDADFFDPDNYDTARRLLDEGIDLKVSDPATARLRLASSKEAADLAFTNSVQRAMQEMAANLEADRQRLLTLEADKFMPAEYEQATAGIDEAGNLFANNDYAGARARAYQALKDMTDLANQLESRLATVRSLKYDTEQLMKQAESAELYRWAPDQRDKVTSLYLKGIDAYQGYKLDDAEENFGAAREAARDTLRIAKEAQDTSQAEQKQKAEELQNQAMQALIDASKLTIVTEDGTVIKPQNWTDEEFLKEIDSMIQEEQKTAPGGQSMAIPADQSTAVMADESSGNLLQQARDLWAQGLKEKAAGNYGKAQDYFNEALRYIEIYKSYAVKGVYTVRLIPDRRDCLWRIAEYKDIYGDPYKWPTIWRRNRKLIQNPDLIYPGWQLVIPPD